MYETYPEGGWEAWLVVFGAWCALFVSLGLMNTLATFQTYIAAHQLSEYDLGTISWIFSIFPAIALGFGVYIGPLFDRYGPRWLLLSGSLALEAGLLATSASTTYWQFILSFSLTTGLGVSLLFTPAVSAVGHYFLLRRGFASGIASTAAGVGGIAFPIIITTLFEYSDWGWAGSLRVLALINVPFLILANIFVKKRLPPRHDATPHPDFRILNDCTFGLFTLSIFMAEFGLFIPIAFISSYGIKQGFSHYFSTGITLAVLNTGSVVGRLVPGYFADRIGPYNSNMAAMCVSIFSCFAVWLPFGYTKAGLLMFAFLFGFATGHNIGVAPVCIGKLCQTQDYGRYYATTYVIAAGGCLIGIPIGGLIIGPSNTGYLGVIVCTGLSHTISLVTCYCAKGIKASWDPRTTF